MASILSGMDWGPLLGLLATVVTGLLTWLANGIKKRNEAATSASNAEAAGLRLAAIGVALLQKGWSQLGPKVQQALADGKMDDAERKTIEEAVQMLILDVTDAATLEEIGKALGLPMAGIIAKIASYLISKWTEAHDPTIVSTSAKTFPVSAADPSGWVGVSG